MARTKRQIRQRSPVEVTSVEVQRVKDVIAFIADRGGKKGRSVEELQIKTPYFIHPRESRLIAFGLEEHHRLDLKKIIQNESGTVFIVHRMTKPQRK